MLAWQKYSKNSIVNHMRYKGHGVLIFQSTASCEDIHNSVYVCNKPLNLYKNVESIREKCHNILCAQYWKVLQTSCRRPSARAPPCCCTSWWRTAETGDLCWSGQGCWCWGHASVWMLAWREGSFLPKGSLSGCTSWRMTVGCCRGEGVQVTDRVISVSCLF